MGKFIEFAKAADEISDKSSKLKKVDILSKYLADLSEQDLSLVCVYFTGNAYPQSSSKKLNIGVGIVRDALILLTGIDESEYKETYLKFGEPGELAEYLLEKETKDKINDTLSLKQLSEFFENIVETGSTKSKSQLLADLYKNISPLSAKYITKVMIGDLRIGLKEAMVEEAIAKAFLPINEENKEEERKLMKRFLNEVKRSNMLAGDIGEVAILAKENCLAESKLHIFNPIKCMLATAEATSEDIHKRMKKSSWYADDKYDGIRAQVHKLGTQVKIFSRDLNDITLQFPEVEYSIRSINHDFILDGEIVAMDGETVLPFFKLQQRLGRKDIKTSMLEEIPAKYMVFDLLYLDGKTYLDVDYSDRRAQLEAFLKDKALVTLSNLVEISTEEEVKNAFRASKERGNEGLVIKDPKSKYKPGKRGVSWLKYKETLEPIDAVITGVEFGHGRRRNDLSDYTFAVWNKSRTKLLNLGKVYSGITDAQVDFLTKHFKKTTIIDHGRFREVEPEIVIEVQYESIQKSDRNESGYALRFPRITKLRTNDKNINDIDDINRVGEIWRKFMGENVEDN